VSAPRRLGWIILMVAIAAGSVVFIVGVFAGWWPYEWWTAFGWGR
jgi:hypothetical protein